MTASTTTAKQPRLDYAAASPKGLRAMMSLEQHVGSSSLEPGLLHLVKLRASQINGCAYCIDMHSKDALAEGESQQRLHGLVAWRETPYYSQRERAALEWTEALTLIHQQPVGDDLFTRLSAEFGPTELTDLALCVVTINGWNRLAIAFGDVPGTYQRPQS